MALSARRFAIYAGRMAQCATSWSADALLDHDHWLTPDDVHRFRLRIMYWIERMENESSPAEQLPSNENVA